MASKASSLEQNDRVPLCHFFFSHPFRVGDVCHGTLPLRHPRLPAPAPLAWRRGRSRARRRGVRRYPAAHLRSHVFLNPPGPALVPRSPPTIEELLWTIRDAWPPPRSLSLDSEKRDKAKVTAEVMGTGNKLNNQPGPRMGLPYRRYSVPETVMRKYSLSRAQTSASDVVTVPTPSVQSLHTSQDSGTKRMSHKACQTSPQDSMDTNDRSHSAADSCNLIAIPTVNIIRSTEFSTKLEEEILSKSSSNSNEFSEVITDYSVSESQVYRSELSLPGAVTESTMFLTVPEIFLDPHDCPKEDCEDEFVFNSDIITCNLESPGVDNKDSNNFLKPSRDTQNDENFTNLLERSASEQRRIFLRSKSNSVPESSEPSIKDTRRIGSASEKSLTGLVINTEEQNVGQIDVEPSASVEGTPTPAPTCPTYDSQGNMSECYITDCDMCTAEGRKCCSMEDSGSQSCSFTSPEMITTNELKSSSDYTTSSMTLDQTVSDRTTSTQDSTISLTSITPESETKQNINISPILVINSEAMLIEMVSPRNKTKDRELFHLSESSPSDSSKSDSQPVDSLHLSDSFPCIISCESGIVPENQAVTLVEMTVEPEAFENSIQNSESSKTPVKDKHEILKIEQITNLQIDETKETFENQLESSQLPEEKSDDEVETGHDNTGNYTTNYLYLTEDESGVNPDSLEIDGDSSTKETEEFEMDSLAINESTEEDSNLLENLGFCEDLSKIQYQPNTVCTAILKNDSSDTKAQESFYGNDKYELLLKDNVSSRSNFMGNVMSVLEDKGVPVQQCSELLNKPCLSPETIAEIGSPSILEIPEIQSEDKCNEVDSSMLLTDRETTMGSVAGGTYWELPGKELVIPRFSALPRTLSMIVNTSSVDCSSDSDLSLPDSLEDSKSDDRYKGLKLCNKYDNRLVRGDIIALLPEESGLTKKQTKEGHAYFLSLTGEEGEIKVERIPEELKQKLLKRSNEIKKNSERTSSHEKRFKSKNCQKKSNKHHHHHCTSTNTDVSPKSSCQKTPELESTGQNSKSTQWEDLGSSKDSSDTLVPSDFSEKDKDTIFQGEYKAKDASTSPHLNESLYCYQQSNLSSWLETLSSRSSRELEDEVKQKDFSSNTGEIEQNMACEKTRNKWVQCENMPHVDSAVDEEISHILIENLKNDGEIPDTIEPRQFKCIEHQVPWSKHICTQVSEKDLLLQDIDENELDNDSQMKTKAVQTADEKIRQKTNVLEENYLEKMLTKPIQQDESNKIKVDLTGSPRDTYDEVDFENKCLNDTDDEERCKKPFLGERTSNNSGKSTKQQEKVLFNKHTAKFNLKSTPTRRPGNLSTRFRQKFEVIPEEKSGSMDSSNDERKSPTLIRGRRASMPSEMILADIGLNGNKSSDSSTSSNDKLESEDCDHIRNVQTSQVDHRRHTIHGNLSSRNTKTDATNTSFEKNEQSRRHTIHGSLALNSKNDSMIKQLNLLGGTLLKGRVFGKQSGVMFGRFRPINEETQVQKDERSLVEEHLERLRRDTSKGREALAVAKTGEQEELLTLSKGWINFYLLRDSQDLGSDGSNGEAGSPDFGSEDTTRRAPPTMKTVKVVGKTEEELQHQYTVQINASPEPRLPDLSSQHLKPVKSPPLSPDITLPDITPTSSRTTSPLLADIPLSLKQELPQIHSRGTNRSKRNGIEKHKPSSKKPPEKSDKKEKVHPLDSDQNLRYLKLSSMKQELQTEKTYFSRSGEIACSELSPSSKSSSSSAAADSPTLPSIKWPSRQLQKRTHPRYPRGQPPPTHPNQQACWTVTLAGSSGNPTQPPPDVEMRLSFSNLSRGPATSQSDSGLGEDGPNERSNKQQALPPALPQSNQWKVMLKTQQETDRSSDQTKGDKRTSLPDFSYTPSTARSKISAKRRGQEDTSRPLSVKVQEILEHNISLHKSSLTEGEWVEGLSVTGLAITPERKPRVPTMSERDLTRQWFHRTRLSQ